MGVADGRSGQLEPLFLHLYRERRYSTALSEVVGHHGDYLLIIGRRCHLREENISKRLILCNSKMGGGGGGGGVD